MSAKNSKKFFGEVFYLYTQKGFSMPIQSTSMLQSYIIPQSNSSTTQNKKTLEETANDKKYVDPLSKWPIRGFAYSNELGAAISEVAPKMGTLLWIPALMYFGADIYDKYKNQEDNYNPSTKRALEQATFQALASVILPTAAVHVGQKTISSLNKLSKDKLTTNAKEATLNFILDFINKSKLSQYENDFSPFMQKFNASLSTYIDDMSGEEKSKGFFRNIFHSLFSSKQADTIGQSNKDNLIKYANEQMQKLIEIRTALMKQERPDKLSNKVYVKFANIQEAFKKEFGKENYLHKSAKYAIREHLSSEIFKLKMFKTLGGFIALGLLIKPIDIFVENGIMKKVVEPNIDKLNHINFKSKRSN